MWYSTPLQFVLCDTITMRMRMREYISHTHVKHYYLPSIIHKPHPARVTNAASFNPAMKRSTKSITLIGHYYRSNSWNDQSEVSICVSIRSNIFYQCVCLFDRSNIFINRCVYSIEYIYRCVRYYLPIIRTIHMWPNNNI